MHLLFEIGEVIQILSVSSVQFSSVSSAVLRWKVSETLQPEKMCVSLWEFVYVLFRTLPRVCRRCQSRRRVTPAQRSVRAFRSNLVSITL